jgi:AAA family ATP:ADP antiporter
MDAEDFWHRLLARVLRPFSKVRPEEAATVVLMTLTAFVLLAAYYLLKTVREPLVLLHGGAALKLYLRAAQAILMLGVVQIYGKLARRVGRTKLLAAVYLFFISNLAIFAVLARAGVEIGLPFFLWVGVFSYTSIAQFWALAADIYNDEQGKRLFPLIGGGSSVGAVAGGLFARALVPYGPFVLMGTAVVMLVGCVALIRWIEHRSHGSVVVHAQAEAPLAEESPWSLLARDRYLWFIAGLVVLLNWVNSSGEYLLDRVVVDAAHQVAARGGDATAYVGAFKADYYAWYNGLGLVLQLFAVSRIFAVAGVRAALFVMPIFALGAYASACALPVLAIVRLVKIGENSLQYSLQDTTRNALFLVATRVEKFVGKTFIDTVAVRVGAILSTVMVAIGSLLDWSTRTFAAINIGLAAAWIGLAVLVAREHRRRGREATAASAGPRTRPSSTAPRPAWGRTAPALRRGSARPSAGTRTCRTRPSRPCRR